MFVEIYQGLLVNPLLVGGIHFKTDLKFNHYGEDAYTYLAVVTICTTVDTFQRTLGYYSTEEEADAVIKKEQERLLALLETKEKECQTL